MGHATAYMASEAPVLDELLSLWGSHLERYRDLSEEIDLIKGRLCFRLEVPLALLDEIACNHSLIIFLMPPVF